MSKTRLFEAVKQLDLPEARRILDAKPDLLGVWNDQGRNPGLLAEGIEKAEQGVSRRALLIPLGLGGVLIPFSLLTLALSRSFRPAAA